MSFCNFYVGCCLLILEGLISRAVRNSYKVFSDLLRKKIEQTTEQWTLALKTIELRDTKVQ